MTDKTPLRRLLSIGKNVFHQLFRLPANPHLVGRNHRHLDQPYRRKLLAPDLVSQSVRSMLSSDPYFVQALEARQGQTLVRVVIVGDYFHANLYHLERFPSGPLFSPSNEKWRDDAILDYHITDLEVDESGQKKVAIFPLVRALDTDLTYDWYEPFASYFRPLTTNEFEILATCTRSCWKH